MQQVIPKEDLRKTSESYLKSFCRVSGMPPLQLKERFQKKSLSLKK
jgi:hypothetical protein